MPKAPFGATLIWGKKGTGKTLAGLNSPFLPIHTIDNENSSLEYFENMDKLINLGILKNPFTRTECLTYLDFVHEMQRFYKEKPHYGTIILDTGGQWSEWVKTELFKAPNAEKMSQIIWGKIRDELRRTIIALSGYCGCLILTAHERQYGGEITPRCNPGLLEIVAISIRLTREPNKRIPAAQFYASRVPFFPPRVDEFSIMKMLEYFGNPADWLNLKEDELIPKERVVTTPEEPEE